METGREIERQCFFPFFLGVGGVGGGETERDRFRDMERKRE